MEAAATGRRERGRRCRPPASGLAGARRGLGLGIAFGLLSISPLAPAPPVAAQLRWLAEQLSERNPRCLYYVETDAAAVALTLDDGPDPETTPALLDLLAAHGARATFFVISDRIEGSEALLRRLVAEGHELGNHHVREAPADDLPRHRFARELGRAHRALLPFVRDRGPALRWYRPPSAQVSDAMLDVLGERGYRCALGSVYPLDAQIPSSWLATRIVLWSARPGSVIVLHEGGGRGVRTRETLRAVLPELARRGLRVVPLSELVDLAEGSAPTDERRAEGFATTGLGPGAGAAGSSASGAILGRAHEEPTP